MATIRRAHEAQAVLNQVYSLNNNAAAAITELKRVRDKLAALPQGDRDAIVAAIGDLGFDAAEVQAILAGWNGVHGNMVAAGLGALPPAQF